MTRLNAIIVSLFVSCLFSVAAMGDQPAVPAEIPANAWTKVIEEQGEFGYQPMVYDPQRRCVFQLAPKRRVMRMFDAAERKWVDHSEPTRKTGVPTRAYDMAVFHPGSGLIVYGNGGAYDPKTRSWQNLGFKVELYGKQYPGGPPVWWGAMAHDPINDELVFLSGAGARNFDDFESTGFVGGSFGTMTLSFKDKLWRRLRPGSPAFKQGRALLRDTWWNEGKVVEKAWRAELKRAWDDKAHAKLSAEAANIQADVLNQARQWSGQLADLAEKIKNPSEKRRLTLAAERVAAALEQMKKAHTLLTDGDSYNGYLAAFNTVQDLRAIYRYKALAEPPPRINSRMVYDPANKCIVVFGGNHGDGRMNDTWIYDCVTRTWRESESAVRPPARQQHFIFHDPASGKILMGGGNEGAWTHILRDLWAYDVKADTWQPLKMNVPKTRGPDRFMSAYDPSADLLLVSRTFYRSGKTATYAIRPDATRTVEAKSAPAWTGPQPKPFPTPDDPAALEKLKNLPANKWVESGSPDRAPRKDWGNIGYDPSSGFALLFGGGHSTYQGDDVTVYLPGANRWIRSHAPNNAAILPQYKNAMGGGLPGHTFQGGTWTHHQRNSYDGAAGKVFHTHMFALTGPNYVYGPPEVVAWTTKVSTRWPQWKNGCWEYDLDRRMWRTLFPPHLHDRGNVFPMDGRVVGLLKGNGHRTYDPLTGKVTEHKARRELPNRHGEGRHYAYIPDKNALFLVSNSPDRPAQTWLYDLKTGEVKDLAPKKSPPAAKRVENVLYMPDQGCVWARIQCGKGQWLYSFEKNTWVEAPFNKPTARNAFAGPYGKEVYSAKYKIFIECGNGTPTYLLRPDMSQISWD